MPKKFVDALALNFRSAPVVDPSNKLGTLFLGQPVEVKAQPPDPAWLEVSATLSGQTASTDGFVSKRFLRDPVSANREALIAATIAEWMRFDRGLGQEDEDPFFKFVGEMWKNLGINDRDGKDDIPWSAAAISFFVTGGGSAYSKFKFNGQHSVYIHDSIKKREANITDTPYWGFRLNERRPQLGDMICQWRDVPQTFSTARLNNDFNSHCDVVVKIDSEKNELLAIGGNVRGGNVDESVAVTTFRLAPGDFLARQGRVFAILTNITDGL